MRLTGAIGSQGLPLKENMKDQMTVKSSVILTSIIETANGKLEGHITKGVHTFKGIPYGRVPTGIRRWRRATPPDSWTGTRKALTFCDRAPQIDRVRRSANAWIRDPGPKSENCLCLNIYTAAVKGTQPVMVYLHGGGFRYGSGAAAGLDGTRLSKNGKVVVVTLNHRLNIFGFANFSDFGGQEFSDTTNLGMLDIVDALTWIRDNITAFGGDPNNVTIFGQSGGGCKVAALMAMSSAKGLFHKAIMQSSSAHMRLATLEDTDRVTHNVVRQLKVTDMKMLQKLPWKTVFDGYLKAVAENFGNDCFRPSVDEIVIAHNPFESEPLDLSRDIPLMIGTAETEKSFYDIILSPDQISLTEQQLHDKVAAFVGVTDARGLISKYRQGRKEETLRDIFNRITSDQMYRRNCIEAAERKSASNGKKVWLYEFTFRIPALGGSLKSPHTMCLPFVFGTTDIAKNFVGVGAEQNQLTKIVQGAWSAFAHTGDPNHSGMPSWPPYQVNTRPTMLFDNPCTVVENPKADDRNTIMACPPFITDRMNRVP